MPGELGAAMLPSHSISLHSIPFPRTHVKDVGGLAQCSHPIPFYSTPFRSHARTWKMSGNWRMNDTVELRSAGDFARRGRQQPAQHHSSARRGAARAARREAARAVYAARGSRETPGEDSSAVVPLSLFFALTGKEKKSLRPRRDRCARQCDAAASAAREREDGYSSHVSRHDREEQTRSIL